MCGGDANKCMYHKRMSSAGLPPTLRNSDSGLAVPEWLGRATDKRFSHKCMSDSRFSLALWALSREREGEADKLGPLFILGVVQHGTDVQEASFFLPSSKFCGSKAGMAFKRGDR